MVATVGVRAGWGRDGNLGDGSGNSYGSGDGHTVSVASSITSITTEASCKAVLTLVLGGSNYFESAGGDQGRGVITVSKTTEGETSMAKATIAATIADNAGLGGIGDSQKNDGGKLQRKGHQVTIRVNAILTLLLPRVKVDTPL